MEGVLQLRGRHGFSIEEIERIHIETFAAGVRLARFPPRHSDDAQYSTPWAVAAALVDGQLGLRQIHPDRLADPQILATGERIRISLAEDLEQRFPEECLARVRIVLRDRRSFSSPTVGARGDWDDPLSDEELERKFLLLVEPAAGKTVCSRLSGLIDELEDHRSDELLALVRGASV